MIGALMVAATLAGVADSGERPTKKKQNEEVRLGALGSVGFPRPLGVEVMMKIGRVFSIGGEYGALPNTTVSGVTAKLHAWAADVRVFPLASPFFFGARLGKQTASTEANISYGGRNFSGGSRTDTTFVNPRIGLLWTWSPGMTVGMDAGVQIPLSHKTQVTDPNGITLPEAATSTTEFFGAKVLPTVTILQLGMLF